MNRRIISILLVVSIICVAVWGKNDKSQEQWVNIYTPAGEVLKSRVVKSVPDRIEGLSNESKLPYNEAMLFIFPTIDFHGIWMKDMLFPIDIAWINNEGVVVDKKDNVSPETYPYVFKPSTPAMYVLEVNAGVLSQKKIEIDTKLTFDL